MTSTRIKSLQSKLIEELKKTTIDQKKVEQLKKEIRQVIIEERHHIREK